MFKFLWKKKEIVELDTITTDLAPVLSKEELYNKAVKEAWVSLAAEEIKRGLWKLTVTPEVCEQTLAVKHLPVDGAFREMKEKYPLADIRQTRWGYSYGWDCMEVKELSVALAEREF